MESVAFDTIVEKHRDSVYRLALHLTGDPYAAEDVLQETFVAAYKSADNLRSPDAMRAWLLTIARNAAARHFRRRVGEPAPKDRLDVDETPLAELGVAAGWGSGSIVSPERTVGALEELEIIADILDDLEPWQREVIVLRDVEGLSGPETAQVLGLPLATMKTRLHRARLELMARLRRRGLRDGI